MLPDVFLAEVVSEETSTRGGNSFSLITLFIVVAVYAVCFTVWRFERDFGIAVLIFATAALVITTVKGRRRLRQGAGFGKADKIGTFYISFLASIGACCALIVGLVVVVWIVLLLIEIIWPW